MSLPDFYFERWNEKFIPGLIRHANDPEVARNLRNIFPNPYTREAADVWIKICSDADESRNFDRAIIINGEAVGGIGLKLGVDVYFKSAELGYWIGREFWGRGIMTEAVKRFTRIGFERFDIIRIHASIFARNEASGRVLSKAGFQLEGIARRSVCKNNEIIDSHLYALLREECS